jgi:LacI family transcriptional regulator
VLASARELGYTRSRIALLLKEQRTRTIGIIADEIATSPWAGRMVRAADTVAAEHGYTTITIDTSATRRDTAGAIDVLAERQVEGFLLATLGHIEVPVPTVPGDLPLVLLNCRPRGESDGSTPDAAPGAPPSFEPDDLGGGRRAAERLVAVGHRDVVMLSSGVQDPATLEREQGYREILEEAGLRPRIVQAGWQMSDGYRETMRLFAPEAAGPRPTAVFAIRDRVAAGVIHAAAVLGLAVPGDLSVIGFDDEDFFAEELTPPLTTIGLPHLEMGERAMTLLLNRIDAGPDEDPERTSAVSVPCPLVERESVASPRT